MKKKLGRYVALRPRRLDDPRIRDVSLRASGLLFRLMMTRSCTSFGAILGGPGALAEEVGVDRKEFSEAFDELAKAGLVTADWTARLLFIPFMAEDDPPCNVKVAIGRGRVLGDLPECDLRRRIAAECLKHAGPFVDDFTAAAANIGGIDLDEELREDAGREPGETVSKPYRKGIDTVRRPS